MTSCSPRTTQPPEEALCVSLSSHRPAAVVQLYLMPSFFLVVLLLGLPLNLLSLWVFLQRLRRWTRSTVLLFNLTLADTSWLLALPLLIHYHLQQLSWGLGRPLCAAVRMLYHNYFYLSIYFVTCVSVDRYLAIVHPLRSLMLLGRRRTCAVCAALWVSTLVLSAPVACMSVVQTCPGTNRSECALYVLLSNSGRSLPYSLCCSVLGFLLPLLSICYCGARSVAELRRRGPDTRRRQRRLSRVLSAALVLFAFFYLPYHLSRNAAIVVRAAYPHSPASWRSADLLFALEMCLCSLSACVNPLFSCFIGHNFRREFRGAAARVVPACPTVRATSTCFERKREEVRRGPRGSTVSPETP